MNESQAVNTTWETIVRFFPSACGAALILACVGSAVQAEKPEPVVLNPISVDLVRQARGLAKAGDAVGAEALLETALAVDPRAAEAYLVLGELAGKAGLPGKAIGFFRDALELQPNNRAALAGQGLAFAQRGALEKASENLAQLRKLCPVGCAEARQLRRTIKASTEQAAKPVAEIEPRPVASTQPPVAPTTPTPAPKP